MGGRLATCVIVAGWAIVIPAHDVLAAGEDDLVLDLGSASDKPVGDAGAGLRKLEFRRIQKGTFPEGSATTDIYREPDEVPRNVTITKTFWMGKYPVTRAQFARFVAETRHQTDAEKGQSGGWGWDGVRLKQAKEYSWRNPGFVQTDDDPVTIVTWGDANAFAAWASRKTGRRVRLPTEAEFEFSARGGTTTPWFAAKTEEEAAALGWYRPAPGAAVGTHPVGRKKANPFGLYDMTGNVNQWTRDVYALWTTADATDPENTTNATSEGERRVLRGGSWMRDPRKGRSAARYRNTPGTRNADNGFRVVVEDAPVIAPTPGAVPTSDVAPTASVGLPEAPVAAALPDAGMMVQAPPVVQRQPSNEGVSWALFAAPIAAVSFVIAWMLARRKREDTNAQGITTRAAADGFHVRAAALPKGTRVRYTCIVKGSEVSDIVPLGEGEETFVFTGGEPSKIQIGRADAVPMPMPPPSSPVPRSPWPSERSLPSLPPSQRSIPPAMPSGPPAPPSNRSFPPSVPSVPSVPPAIPSAPPSHRSLAPLAPAPPISERALPSGPPAPLSHRSLAPLPPAPPISERSLVPPPIPSGPPAPPSHRSLAPLPIPSGPPAPVSGPQLPTSDPRVPSISPEPATTPDAPKSEPQ